MANEDKRTPSILSVGSVGAAEMVATVDELGANGSLPRGAEPRFRNYSDGRLVIIEQLCQVVDFVLEGSRIGDEKRRQTRVRWEKREGVRVEGGCGGE